MRSCTIALRALFVLALSCELLCNLLAIVLRTPCKRLARFCGLLQI